jgi:dipeptidase E
MVDRAMSRLLLISSSNVHGYGYLDHPQPEIRRILEGRKRVAFVPFALHDRNGYTAKVAERLARMGFETTEVRSRSDVESASAIFVGGGNTFRLLKALQELDLVRAIRDRVLGGTPYIGSSAGSNIAAPTIKTTNDMPIVQPASFESLNLVPYQINPHYLDPEPGSTHMGETREQRIREYLEENTVPVVAIREGTMLWVEEGRSTLLGLRPGRIFRPGSEPVEIDPGTVVPL